MATNIRQYCLGSADHPPLVSSGSVAYILYAVFDTDVDVNFEIKITPAICKYYQFYFKNNLLLDLCFLNSNLWTKPISRKRPNTSIDISKLSVAVREQFGLHLVNRKK